jgi:hypothetical protein
MSNSDNFGEVGSKADTTRAKAGVTFIYLRSIKSSNT